MKKQFFLYGILLLLPFMGIAQIQFVQNKNFEEVLAKAQQENKKVFVDFYTVWCGPCKLMSQKVFTETEIGTYFNEKFVNYQINAEDKAFTEQVKRYQIRSYPTLLILDAAGNVLGRQEGALDAAHFLKFAKRTLGELMSFEQMYDKLKADKNNEQLIQAILLEAPDFLVTLPEGSQYDRWSLRIERLYNDYRKRKPVGKMMNPTDFAILMTYHPEADKNDEVLNYIMQNYDAVVQSAGEDAVCQYVFTMNTDLIQRLARKGDPDYLKMLDRLKGEFKTVYESLMNFNGTDVYTGMKYLYDGEYYLFSKKDISKYLELMDQYFSLLGQTITPADYRNAVEAVHEVLNGKFTPEVTAKCMEWITAALQGDMDPGNRMEMLLMLGDCHKMQKDKENAKKCYNQAYMLSLQFGNPGLSAAVQRYMADLENE